MNHKAESSKHLSINILQVIRTTLLRDFAIKLDLV